METKEKLIMLYLYVCEDIELNDWLVSFRKSNNYHPEFTDQEIMSIYLFGIIQGMTKTKQIYNHIITYWKEWFPSIPTYSSFDRRLNALAAAFCKLSTSLIQMASNKGLHSWIKLIDSMPIIVAGNHRSGRATTAKDLCNKGYNSSKCQYYYGLKLHLIAAKRNGKIPLPQLMWITGADESDITASRHILEEMHNKTIFGDKIYADKILQQDMYYLHQSELLTPIKKKMGQQFLSAEDNLYSTAVSKVRQPIESFFNWLNEKTDIQNARRVRSSNGLRVHVMGRLAAAISCILLFNP
jgi:hypothetical protein